MREQFFSVALYLIKAINMTYGLLCFFGLFLAIRSSFLLFLVVVALPPLAFTLGFIQTFWHVDLATFITNLLNNLSNCGEYTDGELCKFMYDMQK